MSIFDFFRWRATRSRVNAAARRLLDAHGDRAFFESHEAAWRAAGDGRRAEARFHRAVAVEIARALQRRAILAAIMAPPKAAGPVPGVANPAPARRMVLRGASAGVPGAAFR